MDPDLTIVLLGDSGVGKSASGNTILGREEFESKVSSRAVTTEIYDRTDTLFGKRIRVVDTPGIFGSEKQIKTWCQELLQSGRPCLFLVVFRVGRFSSEQGRVLRAAERVLGHQEFSQSHLLFTHGDALGDGSLEDLVFEEESSSDGRTFSGRCHLINNKDGEQDQVRALLRKTGHLRTEPAGALKERRMVLLGLPGGGKSSAGNTVLGSERFQTVSGFHSVSSETVSGSAEVEGRWVTVVDSPGIPEAVTPAQLYQRILGSLTEAGPGPHTLVLVVRIGSVTPADTRVFKLLQDQLDSEVRHHCMVLFTYGDELRGRNIQDLIRYNRCVSDLVSMCGGRFCVFNNRVRGNREQVRKFLDQIDEMVSANGGGHYTEDKFRMTQPGFFPTVWRGISRFVKRHNYKICVIVSLSLFAFAFIRRIQAVENKKMSPEL
ncbi:GTPase IMAP family member 8-like [Centropristis striata]|uniref:GTPase IMAP family member 8-like n=1 Tax=Centropristis striata TaxID=184440 RepID=UPI0027DF4486|nr:GTPase IMAP family member 8-like [Centropristis striata]XP_059208129.1 GTPase IMAP family member 8-like [Centropristis striata]